jgi:cytochrome P450
VSKAFTPRLIERLRGRIQALCEDLLDDMERKSGAELVDDTLTTTHANVGEQGET